MSAKTNDGAKDQPEAACHRPLNLRSIVRNTLSFSIWLCAEATFPHDVERADVGRVSQEVVVVS